MTFIRKTASNPGSRVLAFTSVSEHAMYDMGTDEASEVWETREVAACMSVDEIEILVNRVDSAVQCTELARCILTRDKARALAMQLLAMTEESALWPTTTPVATGRSSYKSGNAGKRTVTPPRAKRGKSRKTYR